MPGPKIDWDHLRSSLDRNAAGVAALLRNAPAADQPVAGLSWSVADLGRHLVTGPRRFERFGRGESESIPNDDIAGFNAFEIAAVHETDPRTLANLFLEEHAKFAKLAAEHEADEPFRWFNHPITWAEAGGIYLGELTVHGFDLSKTFRRRWEIDKMDALHVAYGILPILPIFVDTERAAGFTGTYELRLRGGETVTLSFSDGTLTVGGPSAGGRPDAKISADPVAFLLVGYGRASQWGAIAQGKLLASGRKPWLALKFNSLLVDP